MITIIPHKNHKKNFLDKKRARLINPTKTELGLISKDLIQRITSRLLSGPNLWKNSMDAIDWFKNIRDKKRSTFVQFDIIEFYPSITKELLLKSLNHAREYTDITDEEVEITLACRKSVQFNNHRTWVKSHIDNFDVPMGGLQLSSGSWHSRDLHRRHFGSYCWLRAGRTLSRWRNYLHPGQ